MIASTIARFRNDSLNNPAMSLSDPATWDAFTAGSESEAGIPVTVDKALSLAAVWQAASIISGDVAMCPLNVYRRMPKDNREIDRNHPAQYLLTVRPNEEMSAFELWRRAIAQAFLWGNAYIYIERQMRVGLPLSLINMLPDRTTAEYYENKLRYVTDASGEKVALAPAEVIHIKGLSFDNGKGRNLITAARDAIGKALAAQGFSSRFFANGAQAGGILEIPASYTPKSAANLAEGFDKKYSGQSNWFKTVILREGAKFHQTTIDAEKSQLSETSENDVRAIARFANLPGFKLNLADSVSYNSSEQAQLAYVTGCLAHWFHSVAGEVAIKVLDDLDLRGRKRYVEHNYTKLIETDTKTTNEVLEIQLRNTVISPNEWRHKLNLNDRPDGEGDKYENPNTTSGNPPAAAEPKPKDEPDSPGGEAANRLRNAQCGLLADVIGRMARRLGLEARRRAKEPASLAAWMDGGVDHHRNVFAEAMWPVANLLAARNGSEPADLVATAESAFFDAFKARLLFSSADVDATCTTFETEIAAQIIPLIMEPNDGNQSDQA